MQKENNVTIRVHLKQPVFLVIKSKYLKNDHFVFENGQKEIKGIAF